MSLVSHEAGKAYLRLVRKSDGLGQGQKERIAEVEKGLEEFDKLAPGRVTPILVGRVNDTFSSIVKPAGTVFFDLDGDGVAEDWSWVQPYVGVLVWDPLHDGRIESGRQLFGSVTFFLFHRDGYEALRLLDDDQDGKLSGMELDGFAIWTDKNSDGISQRHEVQQVWETDIAAVATEYATNEQGLLYNPWGVCYGDGRYAPTVDWIACRETVSLR